MDNTQQPEHQEHVRPDFRAIGPAGILAVAWTVLPAALGFVLLGNLDSAADWIRSHAAMGVAAYIAIFVVTSGTGVLPTYAQAILGGWVFGLAGGIPAALAGFAGGCLIGYGIARLVSRHRIETLIESNAKAKAVSDTLIHHGSRKALLIVTLLRIPPNSPFALTNLVMACVGVAIGPYLLGTILGMTPRTVAWVALGAYGASQGQSLSELTENEFGLAGLIVGFVLLLIVLGIVGKMAQRAIERLHVQPKAHIEKTRDTV